MKLETAAAATAVVAAADAVQGADAGAIQETVARIKSKDDKTRIEAWEKAAAFGAPALQPLAPLLADADVEVHRAAKRAMWQIVRKAGRPGASAERKAVVKELLPSLGVGQPVPVRREVLWMVSEIAGNEAVPPVAAILGDPELRDDARMVLERLPGKAAVKALQDAFATAPEDFKYALAHSLRVRGVKVEGYPSRKLVPTKDTNVKPVKVS